MTDALDQLIGWVGPHARRVFCGLCVAACVGCSVRPVTDLAIAEPSARLVGVEVTERTDEGVGLALVVEVSHANHVALPLVDSRYTVELKGVGSVTLTDRPNRTLPAAPERPPGATASQTVRLPAAIKTGGVDPVGRAYTVRGTITYERPGAAQRFLVAFDVPLPEVAFKGSGTLGATGGEDPSVGGGDKDNDKGEGESEGESEGEGEGGNDE